MRGGYTSSLHGLQTAVTHTGCCGFHFAPTARKKFRKDQSMGGSLSTITKLQSLLRPGGALKPIQFAALAQSFGLTGITNQWLSRALTSGKINHDTDNALRPLILAVEDLVQHALPFRVAFEDVENVKFLMDLLKDGHQLAVQILLIPDRPEINNKESQQESQLSAD
jgi:hypothetical protein